MRFHLGIVSIAKKKIFESDLRVVSCVPKRVNTAYLHACKLFVQFIGNCVLTFACGDRVNRSFLNDFFK